MKEKEWFSGEENPVRELDKGQYSILDPGFSLINMSRLFGEGCKGDLRFCRENRFWMELPFASRKREPARYLITMKPVHAGCKWQEQEARLNNSSRASIELVVSAAIGIFLVQRKLVVLNHWGSELTSSSSPEAKCAVSITERGCILLYGWPCDLSDESPGVCVIENPA